MTRIEREKHVIAKMVGIYCHHKEGNETLCDECSELLEYARHRLSRCPHGNAKPTCRKCTIHCYKPEMREKMRQIMRYSGPRMLIYSPLTALIHLIRELNFDLGKKKER